MTDNILLNWAAMALSLFNAILLFWLGLMVLMNSDRRAWGIWLGGLGLLLGAAFFVSHTAILGLGIFIVGWDRFFWWTVGLSLAIALPFTWYIFILWYAGYWEDANSQLHRRQRPWYILMISTLLAGLGALLIGVVLLSTPSPAFAQIRLVYHWSLSGVPLLALGYAVFVILCISLSLDALRHPGPSSRVMGSLARQRARPWLTSVSLVLLVVSLAVAGMIVWLVQETRTQNLDVFYTESTLAIIRFDLIVSFLVAVAVVLLGQATTSYEVFTGKTLPRRGLQNQWRWTILLAASYSVVVGGSFALEFHPLYILLPATLVMTFAFAFASWRSFTERERYMAHLRPFVTSQHLYDRLVTSDVPAQFDIADTFATLCADVLGAQIAYLTALGPLASLVGPPLAYPREQESNIEDLAEIPRRLITNETVVLPLDPDVFGGAIWGLPLWSQRGLIGALLLGEKEDGSLYSQEEIEIARVSSERLIDTKASAELAQRLMAMQRERLTQSQVVDLQTRRLLHDEVLPTLQAALIAIDGQGGSLNDSTSTELTAMLTVTHHQISDLLRQIPATTTLDLEKMGFVDALQKTIKGEYAQSFDEVNWQIDPAASEYAKNLSPIAAEVFYYAVREAVRNAAIHGRDHESSASFNLSIAISEKEGLEVTIEDNGKGLGTAGLASSGTGQGLALHSTMMAIVGGTLTVESDTGHFTRITLFLPRLNQAESLSQPDDG